MENLNFCAVIKTIKRLFVESMAFCIGLLFFLMWIGFYIYILHGVDWDEKEAYRIHGGLIANLSFMGGLGLMEMMAGYALMKMRDYKRLYRKYKKLYRASGEKI